MSKTDAIRQFAAIHTSDEVAKEFGFKSRDNCIQYMCKHYIDYVKVRKCKEKNT